MAFSIAELSYARAGMSLWIKSRRSDIDYIIQMIVFSLGIDFLKHFGYSQAVDYTWEHGRSCIVLSFFFAINTVIGKTQPR